jgi:hypothetical protein
MNRGDTFVAIRCREHERIGLISLEVLHHLGGVLLIDFRSVNVFDFG